MKAGVAIAARSVRDQTGEEIDVEALSRELEANLNVIVGQASSLVDSTRSHVPWLVDKRSEIEWKFWRRYLKFLRERKGWATQTLQRLNEVTDQVLDLLEDPTGALTWDRRGMVVGQVQSGKTSNYIGLICKAADAGYKFIVVLAGATNSLRAQTQLRIDEGFLGWDTRLNLALDVSNRRVGVGTLLGQPLLRAIPSTNAEEKGDFSLRVANQFNVRLGGDPVIMVVKKNGSVLKNLTRWAKSLNPDGRDKPFRGVPLLLIDDEADYASVNTKPLRADDDTELDPTTINRRIRELLATFAESAYVGYTATPFANIFIYPDQGTSQFGEDLFPRDFLISLPIPSNHVGPTLVFGLHADSGADLEPVDPLPLQVTVSDHVHLIPNVHQKDLVVSGLPPSLLAAIRSFILVCAARAARGATNQHNSMLIHVTRYVDVQRQVSDLVKQELTDLQNRIRYGDGSAKTSIVEELREKWVREFEPMSAQVRAMAPDLAAGCIPISWAQVRARLTESSQRIQVKMINGSAQDALDYWDHTNGLSVVAIGGDKLSRGLTLEGLSVSYYLRASRMYDTLLQMGRWFGYRPGYVDLCRLYTSEELSEFYSHITFATEELKRDFDMMAERGMSPSQFGLRVRTHPAGLIITATNKMRHGTKMSVSYAGDITETISFDRREDVVRQNFAQFDRFFRTMPAQPALIRQTRVWSGVSGESVADLLEGLSVQASSRRANGTLLASYIRSQMPSGGLTDWSVALVSTPGIQGQKIGGHAIAPVYRAQHPETVQDQAEVYRIRRLVSPTDETLDLSEEQQALALVRTIDYYRQHPDKTRYRTEPTKPGGPFIRSVRAASKGLLLVYPLSATSDHVPDLTLYMGFAISFPASDHATAVEYMVDTVYVREEL